MKKKVSDRLVDIRFNAVLNKTSNALMAVGLALFLRTVFEPFLDEKTLSGLEITLLSIVGLIFIILSIVILFLLVDPKKTEDGKE